MLCSIGDAVAHRTSAVDACCSKAMCQLLIRSSEDIEEMPQEGKATMIDLPTFFGTRAEAILAT